MTSVFEAEGLRPEEWTELKAYGRERSIPRGSTLIRKGDYGESVFLILSGQLKVTTPHVCLLHGPGVTVGEMALFNQNIRTADVDAHSDATVLELSTAQLNKAAALQDPVVIKLFSYLGSIVMERLDEAEKNLAEHVGDSMQQDVVAVMRAQLARSWALQYHALGQPGKIGVHCTKNVGSPEDLAIAYSPGVAEPCREIATDADLAYQLTSKGNLVGVITNGSAVLGLGNIGAAASKPVMEGKAVLFKLFGAVDAFDIEVDEADPQKLIETIERLAPTFGGINLEDIKAPECFEVERQLKKRLDIPVFHDDQHGTAIVVAAGLKNALELTDRNMEEIKVVCSGVGAAGTSCARFLVDHGLQTKNLYLFDKDGFVNAERAATMQLSDLVPHTGQSSLADELEGADVFIGLSAGGILKPEYLKYMAEHPIVFALANPNPEIAYNLAHATRQDLIMATGRSDYPNQVNNVMAFPYIFRGALDIRAKAISEGMKWAASKALCQLARKSPDFGVKRIIPAPFNRELLEVVSFAVAEAGLKEGLGKLDLDLDWYKTRLQHLRSRMN